jgi:hypothetical protein
VCLTFDGWTSVANNAFLAVTGHFVPDASCVVESVVLCLIDASKFTHSGKEYAAKIQSDVIQKFHFNDNGVSIVCVTTDNAANMISTASALQVKHMPCYVHSIQLVINDILFPSLKVASNEIESLNKYVC